MTVLGDSTKPVKVQYWFSPDKKELYLALPPAPDQTSGHLYYFNSDATRLCYTFTVSGRWVLDPATGVMMSKDRGSSLAQSADSVGELGVEENSNLVDAKVRWFQDRFKAGRKELPASQSSSEPVFEVESCNSPSRPSCVKFKATAEGQFAGMPALQVMRAMIVEVAPGWVFAIEAKDDVALEAVESLSTTSDPECYGPFIREQFPQLKER